MKKAILWLLFIIAAAFAWEDNEDECSIDFNNKHCGKHGKECKEGTSCIDGHCICLNSFECDDECVDTKCDVNHCGVCNIKCLPNEVCVEGICTCPNNNNACGTTCSACPTGQHCESDTCVCDNTATSCGAPGMCAPCANGELCINGACMCLNNNGACAKGGLTGGCAACGKSTPECIDGTCVCPNNDLMCASGGLTGRCTACGGNTPKCISGVCSCPNTDSACSSVANCGACPNGQTCINGKCGCCASSGICTQCSTGLSGCSTLGACCKLNGSTCTVNADCCTGICNGGTCVSQACGELTIENLDTALNSVLITGTVLRPTDCLNQCPPVSSGTTYYSLIEYTALGTTYVCICYTSAYVYTPTTVGDNNCTIIDGINYGVNSNNDVLGPPNSEYVYMI